MKARAIVSGLLLCLGCQAGAQDRRLWVLQAPDSVVEYDPSNFTPKQTSKLPAEALRAPDVLKVNEKGQMLFAPNPNDPSPDVGKNGEEVWFWDGKASLQLGRESLKTVSKTGSNQRIIESSPDVALSEEGAHLFWFTNEFSRLERDEMELSVKNTFRAWRTNLGGKDRQQVASFEIPECRCPTGTCSESCPEVDAWVPAQGVSTYFLVNRTVPGQTETKYVGASLYTLQDGEWQATDLADALQRILDAADNGTVIVNAIPDTGCCGWENQSNDQTLLFNHGKKMVLFDEREQYKNPDYDVSFFTANAKLSPDLSAVAMTIQASAKPGGAIQLSEEGQGNPAESQRIRKALAELPAVQIMSTSESGKRLVFLPHASVAGWLNNKEVLIVENQFLVAYNLGTGARRKSEIKVANPANVIVR
jgi:hypothetical protein